jgi:hypothetical protein
VKKLLLALASVALTLACAEVLFRLTLGPVDPVNVPRMQTPLAGPSSIPGVDVSLRPSSEAIQHFPSNPRGYFDAGSTLTYRTNTHGFRGPETTRPKPNGVFRIIGLGDSFTFGRGVRHADTYLSVLERKLGQRPVDLEFEVLKFEVLNFGVTGYDTRDEVTLLTHWASSFEPDLVLICLFLNDTGAGRADRMVHRRQRRIDLPYWQRASVLLDQLTWRISQPHRVRQIVETYQAAFEEQSPGWIEAREALRQARSLSRAEGFDLVLLIFPVLWDLSGPSPFIEIHRRVASFAASIGVPVLDLLPAFEGFDGPDLWVHPTNQHPNERAHAIAGSALFEFLRAQPLVAMDGG